jgi:hypothetical protein
LPAWYSPGFFFFFVLLTDQPEEEKKKRRRRKEEVEERKKKKEKRNFLIKIKKSIFMLLWIFNCNSPVLNISFDWW